MRRRHLSRLNTETHCGMNHFVLGFKKICHQLCARQRRRLLFSLFSMFVDFRFVSMTKIE